MRGSRRTNVRTSFNEEELERVDEEWKRRGCRSRWECLRELVIEALEVNENEREKERRLEKGNEGDNQGRAKEQPANNPPFI